jgi:hypothetical protein
MDVVWLQNSVLGDIYTYIYYIHIHINIYAAI